MWEPASTWKRSQLGPDLYSIVNGTDRFQQSTTDASVFYKEKFEELGINLKSLEGIVQQKSNNVRMVEDGTHIL